MSKKLNFVMDAALFLLACLNVYLIANGKPITLTTYLFGIGVALFIGCRIAIFSLRKLLTTR